jgi:Helix-turn-helix of insertion element transposase
MTRNDTSQPEKSGLTGKQRAAALCLARGFTGDRTAKECNISSTTIDRWKRRADFQAEIRRCEDSLFNEQLRLLKKAVNVAITTLVRNTNERVTPYVQVQSASKLIDAALEVHRAEALEERISELEEIIRSRLQ